MTRLAVLWVDSEGVRMRATPEHAATPVIALARAELRDGLWLFPHEHLESVCSELDRCGFAWAVDNRFSPRTWADHLFAGVPERLTSVAYQTLAELLAGEDGDLSAWAVLQLGWLRHCEQMSPETSSGATASE